MKTILQFFLLFLIFCTAGCSSTYRRFEPTLHNKKRSLGTIKFRIVNVVTKMKMDQHEIILRRSDFLKKSLMSRYPDNFTLDQHDQKAIPLNIEVTLSSFGGNEPVRLSFFTLGLIPSIWEYGRNYHVRIRLNDQLVGTSRFAVRYKNVSSYGILGLILQTHRWVSPLENHEPLHDIGVIASMEDYKAAREANREDYRLYQAVAAAIHSLDTAKLLELYNSKYASPLLLLE